MALLAGLPPCGLSMWQGVFLHPGALGCLDSSPGDRSATECLRARWKPLGPFCR